MVAVLILAAVATATSTPTPTATATGTPAAQGRARSETYGDKIPLQLRPRAGGELPPEPTPTLPPNSLGGIAAKIKLNREQLPGGRITQDEMPRRAPAAGTTGGEIYVPPDTFDEIIAKGRCAKLYPESFDSQVDCVSALQTIAMRAPWGVPSEQFKRLRFHCADEWPNSPHMQNYCEANEVEAWHKLHPEAR